MNRTFKTKFNCIKLIAALFLCPIFSFSIIAQDNPLTEQQLTNLIVGLKDALQENLKIVENTNGKQYQAITQKWDARQDLEGKSKRQVIDLLYQDVKSVVTNSGMQYQIYQVFSFYKQMPDSQFSQRNSFKDPRDGQVYGIKKIGNLTWMKENLRFNVPNASWCFDNDDENCAELGRLYTFQAALKACPYGWRLPSDNDWLDLEKTLGLPQDQWMIDGYSTTRGGNVGQKLKSGGSSGLEFKISGFASIGNGDPEFDGIEGDTPRSYFWTSTSQNVNNQTIAVRRRIEEANGYIFRFSNPTAGYAVAVRCVQ
ncbi:MAG TPA: FISUMP domain-containing protein [Pyrinomonadaceae bacterium]|nr:FISUMP domain-containing protein [Pyrinomonadaceae bacterium]